MTQLDDLNAKLDEVAADVADMKTRVTTDLDAAHKLVAGLQAAGLVTVDGSPVDLSPLTAKLESIGQTVTGVDAPAPVEQSPASPPADAPPPVDAPPTPTVDAPPPSPDQPAAPPVDQALPLYTFDGDPATADSPWTKTDLATPDGKPLFTFAGDTAGGPATGDGLGGVWHAYAGPTVPASSASLPTDPAAPVVDPTTGAAAPADPNVSAVIPPTSFS